MELRPVVQIDTREKLPLDIQGYPTERVGLPCGDYGVQNFSDWQNPRFICERKSVADLVSSLTTSRKRFMRETELLRRFGFACILIEGVRDEIAMGSYRSLATAQSLLASLDAVQVRCGIHLEWAGTAENAARRLESLIRQFCKGIQKDHARLAKACQVALRVEPRGPKGTTAKGGR